MSSSSSAAKALLVVGLGLATTLGGLGRAGAGTLTTSTKKVAGGQAAVASCGSLAAGVVSYTVTAGNVTKVVVTGLPSTCNGAALSVTLVGSGNASLGQGGPVAISSQTASFASLTATPAAAAVVSVSFAATGP